ncbi:ecdysone oxidase-like [Anticarsia gemmatalis]|uniref:ecdysone oxidase-like n=1 Tax=Anticarsia gemmatalis TaxID=129554 RepID=UPI003F765B76
MATASVISKIKTLQGALSILALLNPNAKFFPSDADVADGNCYDYVVVGGGTAGCVVTARLVEAGYSVLIIEAGVVPFLETYYPAMVTYIKNTRVDWNYTSVPDGYLGKCHQSSGMLVPKALGGAGSTGYLIYAKGNPSDYEKWYEATDDESWKWENMDKYFKMSECLKDPVILNSTYKEYHGLKGKVNATGDTNQGICNEYLKGFELAGQPVPLDNIGNGLLGYSRGLYLIDSGIRVGAAYSYVRPIKNNPKIHISYESLATRIIFNKHKKAVGVEFLKKGKKITVRAKKEVIISAGPIKSPQLLMLSGIGPEKELEKYNIPCLADLPVGKNLKNMVGALLVFKTNKTAKPEPFNAHKFVSPMLAGYATLDNATSRPFYETLNYIIDDHNFFLSLCGFTQGLSSEICDNFYNRANGTQILTVMLCTLDVKSSGDITLRSTNPEDPPFIKTGYFSNDRDMESLVKAIQHYMKVVSTPYFKEMGLEFMLPTKKCDQFEKYSREFWRCYSLCLMTGHGRYVGTNAMGTVVDTDLYVKGVHKLRVVDASVIPDIVSGATFAPIVAVAEKAAEKIIKAAKCVV